MVEFNGGMNTNTLYQALESHIQKQRGVKKRDMERIYKSFKSKEDNGRRKLYELLEINMQDLQKVMANHIEWEEKLYSDIVNDLNFDFAELFGHDFTYSQHARMITLMEIIRQALDQHTEDLTKQLKEAFGEDAHV